MIHGKCISCFDLNKNNEPIHAALNYERVDYYDFSREPLAIYNMDKNIMDPT